MRGVWHDALFPAQHRYASFDEFWDHSLHDGVVPPRAAVRARAGSFGRDWRAAARTLSNRHVGSRRSRPDRPRSTLHVYEGIALR
jgi:hypothetical protein